jgi:hypothetical protein
MDKPESEERQLRLEAVLADYFRAAEAGQAPDRAALLACTDRQVQCRLRGIAPRVL